MQIVSLIILCILFLIIPACVHLYCKLTIKKGIESKSKQQTISHFDRMYKKNVFSSIKRDSAIAGKWNSPFVPDGDIIDIANSGINIIGGKKVNLFENVGDFNERPKWEKLS